MLNKKLLIIPVIASILIFSSCSKDISYETSDKGLKYHFFVQNEGPKAKVGDFMTLNFIYSAKMKGTDKDTILRNTWKDGQPIQVVVQEASFKGGIEDGLQLLTTGDSVALQVNADSLFKKTFMAQRPAFIDSGSYITFIMKVVKVQNKDEFEKDQAKLMEDRKTKMEADKANQKGIDNKMIQDFILANKIPAIATKSGLYYYISKKGNGAAATPGSTVSVNYVGKLLNGTEFDSSVGKDPLEFQVGVGMVIPGWDEGLQLLNAGSKAMFIIPSTLGYGPMQAGDKIPANSVLLFEVELLKVTKK
jgi:FKBP-type peptidyl-prolyl cis-trans isomerase FkpA